MDRQDSVGKPTKTGASYKAPITLPVCMGELTVTKTLDMPGGRPRILTSTTTTKMAQRMLHSSRVIADILPVGFYSSPGLDILLALHLAEESAQYPSASEMCPSGSASPAVTLRWVNALVSYGLVEQHDDLLALSTDGHATVIKLVEAVFAAQRALD